MSYEDNEKARASRFVVLWVKEYENVIIAILRRTGFFTKSYGSHQGSTFPGNGTHPYCKIDLSPSGADWSGGRD